ncbi:MAG: RNA polymerase sigma factor [Lachnospiraceae bacterium]|nr:RNA polymerase sigma factor [Lachnospiraceae bacterium]
MKKQELRSLLDAALLDKLFGFCYARTSDSHEAQELCSDIIFELVKTAGREGDIQNAHAFIWRTARNVYADFCDRRKKRDALFYPGDPSDVLPKIAAQEADEDSGELLRKVYRQIAFLTKAYREVMILYYLDGRSAAEIAGKLGISETAVRQRLFSARKKIKSEVEEMTETTKKPTALDTVEFVLWGNGNPDWGDPRNVCTRQLSKQIVWLCRKKPMSAAEAADKLNVPTVYVEEELEILTRGANGEYGLLRRLDNGKYAVNIILFDKNEMERATGVYTEHLPDICRIISEFIEAHKQEYMAFPYLNKRVDFNLVLWQQISVIARIFGDAVGKSLSQKHFAGMEQTSRPFSLFGYQENEKYYGGGWDDTTAHNLCGYSQVILTNIYTPRIKQHFECNYNLSNDKPIQLAIRAVSGLEIASLSEDEKEQAAKAIACGYLYREGETLYTKILVIEGKDAGRLFDISRRLSDGFFEEAANAVAEKLAAFIRRTVPEYLLPEWRFANTLAAMPVLDAVVDTLIEKGLLIPPENGIGAEGCWMYIDK